MSVRDYIGCTTSAHLFYSNSEFCVAFGLERTQNVGQTENDKSHKTIRSKGYM
jgi:hypothetical protein